NTPLVASSTPPCTTSKGFGNTRLCVQVTASCQQPRRRPTTHKGSTITPIEKEDGADTGSAAALSLRGAAFGTVCSAEITSPSPTCRVQGLGFLAQRKDQRSRRNESCR